MRNAQMSPQCETVLNHLNARGSISGVEAAAIYRVRYLPRRIKDLKDFHGVKIRAERRADPTGQRYVRYYLNKE